LLAASEKPLPHRRILVKAKIAIQDRSAVSLRQLHALPKAVMQRM
jgi:hypothetical protein